MGKASFATAPHIPELTPHSLCCSQEEVFTSAYASAAYIKNVLNLPADKKVYVLGEKGVEDELDAVGIQHTGGTVSQPRLFLLPRPAKLIRGIRVVSQDPADNVLLDLMDFSSITSDPSVGAVLCGLDMHLNYKKVAKGFKYLRENEGCHFVATNLDSTFPTHGTVYPGEYSFKVEAAVASSWLPEWQGHARLQQPPPASKRETVRRADMLPQQLLS